MNIRNNRDDQMRSWPVNKSRVVPLIDRVGAGEGVKCLFYLVLFLCYAFTLLCNYIIGVIFIFIL